MASPMASATLLVGFYDFNNNTVAENANYQLGGFSGTVTKNGEASVNNGGSNDGTYGAVTFAANNPTTNDGYARSLSLGDPVFTITKTSSGTTPLAALLFDAANQAGGGVINVSYRTDAGAFTPLGTATSLPVAGPAGTSTNYGDYFLSLVGFSLSGINSFIEFKFDGSPNGRVDNIAITAIPEPGSMLALGCLACSGAFLRSRRQSSPVIA